MVWVTRNTFCPEEERNQTNEILRSWQHPGTLTLINYTWGFQQNKTKTRKTRWAGKAKEKEGQRTVGEGQWGRAVGTELSTPARRTLQTVTAVTGLFSPENTG